MRRRDFILTTVGAVATTVAGALDTPLTLTWRDDYEARWDALRERLGVRLREIAIDGHKVKGCYIRPEGRDGLRHVHVLLKNEEPIEFFL